MMHRLIISVLLSMVCSSAIAAEYSEQSLHNLFTDRQQREKIDALRSGKTIGKQVKKSETVTVTGYITRSDGKSVVWLNGKNTLNSSKVEDVTVYRSTVGKDKKVSVAVDGKSARLKPGETWYRDSGKIVDTHK